MLCILYHKIPWWPVQREREGRRKLVQLYIRNQGRNRVGGPVPWIVHREENVADQSSSDWRKRRRWGEAREVSQQSWFLFVASGFVASSTVLHLLTLLSLSLPDLSGRSVGMWLALVTPGGAGGFTFSETRKQDRRKRFQTQIWKE